MSFCAKVLGLLLVLGSCAGRGSTTAIDRGAVLIDSARSQVQFELPLLLIGSVKGRFEHISGQVQQTADGLEVCASVAVNSARMRRQKDTDELLGTNFFDAQAHPLLSFVSTPLARTELKTGASLNGKLRVRGITRPARFTMAQLSCPDPLASADCKLVLQGAISRADFGMRARRGVLGNAVALQLEIQLCGAGSECEGTSEEIPGCSTPLPTSAP